MEARPILPSSRKPEQFPQLTGDRVVVLHAPSRPTTPNGFGGGDVDCAVSRLDEVWPLRLPADWRLCGISEYDVRGRAWVLERDGQILYLDTLEDRYGLGRYGFPTAILDAAHEVPPAIRASYLALKRLRKGIRDEAEWTRIRALAQEDWLGFRSRLQSIAGLRLARLLDEFVREGASRDDRDWRMARRLQTMRRIRTPLRGILVLLLQGRRVLGRIMRPTGWVMLVVGPDGSGKSSLAGSLLRRLEGVFRREVRIHWRPGLLPRPGRLFGRAEADASEPHSRSPYGRALSVGLLGYHWLDFFLGGWLRVGLMRLKSTLVIQERGWWDIAVDPRRYRLNVPPRIVRALGKLLPRPDVVLVLEASPEILSSRKAELTRGELTRQMTAWRRVLPGRTTIVRLDTSRPLEEVADEARGAAIRMLESRAVSRLGAGWADIGGRTTRWWLPRGPRRAAREGLSVYQPITIRSRLGWAAARHVARLGAFRILPRGEAPPRAVREALAPHLPPRATIALSRANHPGRYVAAIIADDGRTHGIAKVATDVIGATALAREAEAIEGFGPLLQPPIAPPTVLAAEPGLLLLEPVAWRPRPHPWRLEPDIARALGVLFRGGEAAISGVVGTAHGDSAPWNLLRTEQGWVLIDWEAAMESAPPFYDLCHYLIQGHTLLGRPSWKVLMRGFEEKAGWVGDAIRAYAEGAGFGAHDALSHLDSYLRISLSIKEEEGDDVGRRARLRLLRQLSR